MMAKPTGTPKDKPGQAGTVKEAPNLTDESRSTSPPKLECQHFRPETRETAQTMSGQRDLHGGQIGDTVLDLDLARLAHTALPALTAPGEG